jgi:hypothetical protein
VYSDTKQEGLIMAFVVETGSGVIDANSYATTAYADAYFTERSNTVWATYTLSLKQGALIRATDYIEMRYAALFSGTVLYPDTPQALSFPRKNSTGVSIGLPINIQRAACEYAVRSLVDVLVKDNLNVEGVSTRIKIGSIEQDTIYPTTPRQAKQFASYPTADLLISPYLKSNTSQVVR